MKAIVTGANGFIGSKLVDCLACHGIEVSAIDMAFNPSHIKENEHVHLIQTPIEKLNQTMLEGEHDLFYHLAWGGVNGVNKGNIDVQLRNVETALFSARLAKELGCKKFLCAGTIAERGLESLPVLKTVGSGMLYGASKQAARTLLETYCKNVGLEFVWMQFSNIYGPSNRTGNIVSYTLSQLMKNEEATFGKADQPYDLVFVDDLIKAAYLLGAKDTSKSFYFIGSGSPRILGDYLRTIGRLAGKEELIRIGLRPDDGVRYDYSMFDAAPLIRDIGEYVSMPFEKAIEITIEGYKRSLN